MGKQLREHPEPPRARAPQMNIPLRVDEIVMRALSKRAAMRFESAAEMRAALAATLVPEEKIRSRARKVAFAVLGGAALLAAFGVTARLASSKEETTAALLDEPLSAAEVAASAGVRDDSGEGAQDLAASAPAEASPATPPPVASAGAPPAFAREVLEGRGMTKAERVRALVDARSRARTHLTDPALLKAWAWAAYRAGDLKDAKRAAQMWALHDAGVEPKLLYATVLEASGHRTLAKSILDQWVATHPDADEAKELLARLGHPTGKGHLARK